MKEEGSRTSPKSVVKLVMNSNEVMVTAEH